MIQNNCLKADYCVPLGTKHNSSINGCKTKFYIYIYIYIKKTHSGKPPGFISDTSLNML